MYEDYVDKKIIEDYEKKEKKSRKIFLRAEDILRTALNIGWVQRRRNPP